MKGRLNMRIFDKLKKKHEINREEKAIGVVTQILKAFHSKEYGTIMSYVDESKDGDLATLFECVESTLSENGFDAIDEYGTPCNFHPQYEYSQLSLYEYNDNTGFTVDYDMTSNSELIDLTLQLEFLYTDNGLKIILLGVQPQ